MAKDGTIYQFVDADRVAWHAGEAIPGWGNMYSIGIEMQNSGRDDDCYTDTQLMSVAYILKMNGVSKENVRQHKEITTDPKRKVDLNSKTFNESAENKLWSYWAACIKVQARNFGENVRIVPVMQ